MDALEGSFHENNNILKATHGVVTLILKEQEDLKVEVIESKRECRERFNQLELLIRQCLPRQ
ncbi:hypothetical protein [Parendozoicomonas haliclonae]|nr:hypothetical protein [Parendozoicomonas haliclonae]